MTTNAILPALLEFNDAILACLKVPLQPFKFGNIDVELPSNPCEASPTGIILVPQDILRDLPIAHDWDDVADAAAKNAHLRDKMNERIGGIWTAHTRKEKLKVRHAVLGSKEAFETLLAAIEELDQVPYDTEADILGHYAWRDVLSTVADKFPLRLIGPKSKTLDELERITLEIIEH